MKNSLEHEPPVSPEHAHELFEKMRKDLEHPELISETISDPEVLPGTPLDILVADEISTKPLGDFSLEVEVVGEVAKKVQENQGKKPERDSIKAKKKTGKISTAAAMDDWQREKEAAEDARNNP